jgi:uncharacterized membrane protein YqjE
VDLPVTNPRVIVKEDRDQPVRVVFEEGVAWSILRIFGVIFIFAGGIDLALLWYPARLGLPEFEFVTISQFVAGMPVLTTGLVALALVALGTENRRLRVGVGVVVVLMLVLLFALLVLFALTVPVALKANLNPDIRTGVKKSIVRTTVQFATYGLGYLALGWKLLRSRRAPV